MSRVSESATILQHPFAAVPMLTDPRQQPLPSTARPVDALPEPPAVARTRDEELRRVEGIDAVALLVDEFGAKSVARWVKYHAALKGEAL